MDIITTILSSLGAWGWIAVIIVILFRPEIITRILDFLPKKNGNGNSKKLGEIDEHLELLTENHISHVQKGIDKLIEMSEKQNVTLALMQQTLEDIKSVLMK